MTTLYGTLSREDEEKIETPIETMGVIEAIKSEDVAVAIATAEANIDNMEKTLDAGQAQIDATLVLADADDAVIAAGSASAATAQMTVTTTALMAKQMGFPSKVVTVSHEDAEQDPMAAVKMAADDKRSYARKAIDLIRKGFVKLNAMIRKAYAKVLGVIGGVSKKAKGLQAKITDELNFDAAKLEETKAEDHQKRYAGAIALDNTKISSTAIARVELESADLNGEDIFTEDSKSNKLVSDAIKSKRIDAPDEEYKNAEYPLVSVAGDMVNVLVMARSEDDATKIDSLKIVSLRAEVGTEKEIEVGNAASAQALAVAIEKAGKGYSKFTDGAFKEIDNASKTFEENAKSYGDDPTDATKAEYDNASMFYKTTPKYAFKRAMGRYKSIKNGLTTLTEAISVAGAKEEKKEEK